MQQQWTLFDQLGLGTGQSQMPRQGRGILGRFLERIVTDQPPPQQAGSIPLKQEALREAARRVPKRRVLESVQEAKDIGALTVFLSHSHQDMALAKGFKNMAAEAGWDVYIDSEHVEMQGRPDRETAELIKAKIVEMHGFLFLATAASMKSVWCPWEIGYADATKGRRWMCVLSTEDERGSFYGNEYLQLYPTIRALPLPRADRHP